MPQIGSNQGIVAQNLSGITDSQGNQIISNENAFGASPAGEALIGQQLFGLPNGTFNLTPPDVYSSLGSDNRLPYWDWAEYSDGTITATPTYDSATQTWGIKINPGTAASGDYCTLTTRAFLLNDDNLGLRQKAFAVISKGGTAAASTQWNFTLSAIYYDTTNTAIGTAAIGTALDTGTWTSLSGFTTAGGSAINASARYVELQFKLTATAAVTGSATVTIKSCLLSSKIGANSSFLITETITSSTTWTVPTGVSNLVAIALVGAGGGGAGGGIAATGTAANPRISGGGGGGGGAGYLIARNVSLGTATSLTIGIGAGGAGGAGTSFTKAAAATTTYSLVGANGAAGGATTVAIAGLTYLTCEGGGGGTAGTSSILALGCVRGDGGTPGNYSSLIYDIGSAAMTADSGGKGGSASTVATFSEAGQPGTRGVTSLLYSYVSNYTGAAGGAAVTSGTATTFTVGAAGTVGGSASLSGGGGGASSAAGTSAVSAAGDVGGSTGTKTGAAGAGGATVVSYITGGGAGTVSATAGAGGSATQYGAGGGGAGGGVIVTASSVANYNARAITATSGAGGGGATGYVVIAYVA